MRRNRERGFTLIELLVAAVIGVIMVLALGTLGLNSFHQRITADSLSAAATLAERQIERLKALPNPATNALLTAGTHTAAGSPLRENGTTGGPFAVQWVVENNIPVTGIKKITMTVDHVNNDSVYVQLVTYYKVP